MPEDKGLKLQGEITSTRMNKTVVVKVSLLKHHPKYHKQYTVFKRYLADTYGQEYKVEDIVEIQETKPISRKKRWIVIRKVK